MDLTALVSAAQRLPAVELRAPGERVTLSVRTLAAIVESVGATPELARELAARAPADRATLIVPAGSGQARIDLGQRQIAIPAALRDAIAQALERSPAAAGATEPRSAGAVPTPVDPVATARLIDASAGAAARVLAAPIEPERARARAPARPAHAAFSAPLFEPGADSGGAAQRLRRAVEGSGIFFESHLAAWAHDEGSAPPPQLRDEARMAPATARSAVQLDVLAHEAIVLQGPVWAGQTATIELARERDADAESRGGCGEGETPAAFSARLAFDLPHLGALAVHVRLVGTAVAVTVRSARREGIARELPQLAAQLAARGLVPAALQAVDSD